MVVEISGSVPTVMPWDFSLTASGFRVQVLCDK